MTRSDMRDFECNFIKELLPNKPRGVKRVDDRRVINGILYALRTGIPWRDMPEQYGRGQRSITASIAGQRPESGTRFSMPSWILTTSISSWWMPLRLEPILVPRS